MDSLRPWTTLELAVVIRMSDRFVRSEIRCGEIQAAKFGTCWRIPHDEVLRYLTEKRFPYPGRV